MRRSSASSDFADEAGRAEKAFGYVLSVLLSDDFLAGPAAGSVRYGRPSQAQSGAGGEVCIVPSGFFGPKYGSADSLPLLPLKDLEGVPLLYGRGDIQRRGRDLIVHADIIASAFFCLTRYEETVRPEVRDKHGRFPGRQSLTWRAGFLDRPIVEEYARLLRKWLRDIGVNVPEPKRSFSVALTHDVDWVRKYAYRLRPVRTLVSALLGFQPWSNVSQTLRIARGAARDPFDTFQELIDLDGSMPGGADPPAAESIYFFMAGGKSRFDRMYNVRGKFARDTIRQVQESGAAVGLHPSYEAGRDPAAIAKEKAILEEVCGRPITRSRYHWLTWREVEDGYALAKAGITDDYTLGYADVAGFRLGVCRPIALFDPVRMQPLGITAHPLIVMDGTLDQPQYMGLEEQDALDYCKRLMDRTRAYHGEFVVLWHNTSFVPAPGNYHPSLYRRLLEALPSPGRQQR